jgi:hypothetical protein
MAPSGRTQLSRRPVPQKAQLASFFCQLNQSSKVLSHSDAGTLETTMSGAPAWRAVVFFLMKRLVLLAQMQIVLTPAELSWELSDGCCIKHRHIHMAERASAFFV